MYKSRDRVLGALVGGLVVVTGLGTPVLSGTAALGGATTPDGRSATLAAAGDVPGGSSAVPAALAVTDGAPPARVEPTGDPALDAIASGAVTLAADTAGRVHYVSTPDGKPLKAPASAGSGPAA